jgi:hypothetical protein
MHKIAVQAPKDRPEFEISARGSVGQGEGDSLEIRRERTNFTGFFWRSDQEIGILVVQPAQGANNVADIGAYTEVGHTPDIDRNVHWEDLTIECGKDAGESGEAGFEFRVSSFECYLRDNSTKY